MKRPLSVFVTATLVAAACLVKVSFAEDAIGK
jgi:hypothetical protein